MTDITQTGGTRKSGGTPEGQEIASATAAHEAQKPIGRTREGGAFGDSMFSDGSIDYVERRVNRLDERLDRIEFQLDRIAGGQVSAASRMTGTEDGKTEPEKPSPPANSTADYALASAYAGALLWANPDLRGGFTRFLPLAPALLSLADDGLNKQSGKRAILPAVVGIGSLVAFGGLLK